MKSISPVRKFKSRKEWENYAWKMITSGLANSVSSENIEQSLAILVTAYEKEQMIKRAAAVSFLKQGKSYREIGDLLWLSHPTISSIKKSITAKEGYVSYYERSRANKKRDKQEKSNSQFSSLLEAFFEVPPPPRQGRRIPEGKRVMQPHGKLVYPRRLR